MTSCCDPPLHLIRRLARTPPSEQCTTSITLGELIYGAEKRKSPPRSPHVELIASAGLILPFDEVAGQRSGQ